MIRTDLHGHHGICAVIRDMFITTNNVFVRYRLRIAMRQAKALDKELREAKANHEKITGGGRCRI